MGFNSGFKVLTFLESRGSDVSYKEKVATSKLHIIVIEYLH